VYGSRKIHRIVRCTLIRPSMRLDAPMRVDDIAATALTALTNGLLTGASITVDGGEHLV
jgi:hypothetical protein